MKKSRFVALTLSLAMALSLSAPAWAVEGEYTVSGESVPVISAGADPADYLTLTREESDYPDYFEFAQQYFADHPEHYAAFDADSFFAEMYGEWYPKEEYMADMDLADEEAFRQDMWGQWLDNYGYGFETELFGTVDRAYQDRLTELYSARHPGELEALRTEDLLSQQGYTETLTPAERFMKDYGLDSEDQIRPYLLNTYVGGRIRAEQVHADYLSYAEGWPEQLAAFDPDAYFAQEYSWYDDKAAFMRDRTLFSETEFAELMFVEYVEQNYWEWEDEQDTDGEDPYVSYQPLTLVVNGRTVAWEEEGVLTAENGVSYAAPAVIREALGAKYPDSYGPVPIKQVAQQMGWDVVWNAAANEVVLIDPAGAKTGDLSSFDKMMTLALKASKTEPGKTYTTTETIDVSLTALNSIDGDKTYKATVTATAVQRDGVFDVRVKMSAAQLADLLSSQALAAVADGKHALSLRQLKALLGGLELNVILDLERGMVYCNAPFLPVFAEGVSEDTWFAVNLGTDVWSMVEQMLSGQWDTGALLYDQLLAQSAQSPMGAEYAYNNYTVMLTTLNVIAGPDAFIRRGDAITWKLDADALNAALRDVAGTEMPGVYKEYAVLLTVDGSGRITSSVSLRLDTDALGAMLAGAAGGDSPTSITLFQWLIGLLDFRMTASGSGNADKSQSSVTFQWKNQMELTMDSASTRKTVKDSELRAAPPEGAVIISL